MKNEMFRMQDAVREMRRLCKEAGTEKLHVDTVVKALGLLQPVQLYMLTEFCQQDASPYSVDNGVTEVVGHFLSEDAAISEAKKRLSRNANITLEEVERLSRYCSSDMLALVKDERREVFFVKELEDAFPEQWYLLRGSWSDDSCERVSGTFPSMLQAVSEAERMLAADFGISLQDVRRLAWLGDCSYEKGSCYELGLTKDDAYWEYDVSRVEVAKDAGLPAE